MIARVTQGNTLAMLFPKCTTCEHEIENDSEHYDSDPYAGSAGDLHSSKCACSWGTGSTEEEADAMRLDAADQRADQSTDWRFPDWAHAPKDDYQGWVEPD